MQASNHPAWTIATATRRIRERVNATMAYWRKAIRSSTKKNDDPQMKSLMLVTSEMSFDVVNFVGTLKINSEFNVVAFMNDAAPNGLPVS